MDHSIQVTHTHLCTSCISLVDREIFSHESIIFFFFIDVNQLKDTTIISRRPNSKRFSSSFNPSVSKIQSNEILLSRFCSICYFNLRFFLCHIDNTLIILYCLYIYIIVINIVLDYITFIPYHPYYYLHILSFHNFYQSQHHKLYYTFERRIK